MGNFNSSGYVHIDEKQELDELDNNFTILKKFNIPCQLDPGVFVIFEDDGYIHGVYVNVENRTIRYTDNVYFNGPNRARIDELIRNSIDNGEL